MATYNSPTDILAGALAKSSHLNAIDAAAAAAFALLPDEALLTNGTVNFAVDTGVASAYVVSLSDAPASYADGLHVVMRPLYTNTGASTINVNSLGVKSIKQPDDSDLSAGDITAGVPISLRYSSVGGCFYCSPSDTHTAYSFSETAYNYTQADSPVTLTASQCNGLSVINNRGATGDCVLNLPAGFEGGHFRGVCFSDGNKVQFTAAAGEYIKDEADTSIAAGSVYVDDYGVFIEGFWDETASAWVVTASGVYYIETS